MKIICFNRKGHEWLFTDPVLAMSFGAVGAYSYILTELVPSLRNEKKYNRFCKKGDLIAKEASHRRITMGGRQDERNGIKSC